MSDEYRIHLFQNSIKMAAGMLILTLIMLACTGKQLIQKSEIKNAVTYSDELFFNHLKTATQTGIKINENALDQFEMIPLPVRWESPDGEKFQMRVYHAAKAYEEKKDVMIFINGGPGESIEEGLGNALLKEMGESWDVVLFDQRGCGLSQTKSNGGLIDLETLTMNQTIEDINALVQLVRKRGAENVILAGGSSGAFLATHYGTQYADTIDLLYIDGGAASADFHHLTVSLATEKITQALMPEKLENIADFFNVDPAILFTYLLNKIARDPELKRPLWNDFKLKNSAAEKRIKGHVQKSILVSTPDQDINFKKEILSSSDRLYYIMGCMEILPKETKSDPYGYYKRYHLLTQRMIDEYHLIQKPFNFVDDLKNIRTKTIITNGLEDYTIPFEASKEMYRHMDPAHTLLMGFKHTGHVALASKHLPFILKTIKTYLESSSKERVLTLIRENDQVVTF